MIEDHMYTGFFFWQIIFLMTTSATSDFIFFTSDNKLSETPNKTDIPISSDRALSDFGLLPEGSIKNYRKRHGS